jgi:peptide/nickel transport system substrate-binding protein
VIRSRAAIALAIAAALTVAACAPTGSSAVATGAPSAAPPQRGAGGTLNIRFVEAPRVLNPYLSQGGTDVDASRPVLEALAGLGPDFKPAPRLAAEIPTLANGGVSKDLTNVTWKLRPNVKWSDGSDLTSADVVFTWRFIADKASGAVGYFDWVTSQVRSVEALDPLTVRVTYAGADANLYRVFVGAGWPILQERQFKDYLGSKAKDAPGNLRPIGTGPFKVKEFRPNDIVTYEVNDQYREANKPFFKEIVIKGSGDPTSAARAVFETGEADLALFGGVDGSVLKTISGSPDSKGVLFPVPGTAVERLLFNRSDPDPALGEMRSEPGRPHPFLTDLRVRQALAMAVDRTRIASLYTGGLTAEPTCNILAGVPGWTSPNTAQEPVCRFDLAAAERLLDQAGWVRGSDGVRQKAGVRMKVIFATTVNTTRQSTQAIIKDAWSKIGVETELKAVTTGKFFGNDPDAAARFFSDVEMFANDPGPGLDAAEYLKSWTTGEIKTRSANWTGGNFERWSSADYDALFAQLKQETDDTRRNALYIRMNDMLVRDVVMVPIVLRANGLAGYAKSLKGYSLDLGRRWDVADWYR